MKILLIQPKMNKRPMDTNLKVRMSSSLALLTLMRLTPDEHETIMVNENVKKIDYELKADLVGITITLDILPRAVQIAKIFQSLGIHVIAGGVHVTCCPEDCSPYFDAICIGPAERIWAKIIQDAESRCLQREYCDMGNFCGSEIASPMYGHTMQNNYLYTNVVLTSRGCPNRCSFCYNSCKNRLYIRRPISDVLRAYP